MGAFGKEKNGRVEGVEAEIFEIMGVIGDRVISEILCPSAF